MERYYSIKNAKDEGYNVSFWISKKNILTLQQTGWARTKKIANEMIKRDAKAESKK